MNPRTRNLALLVIGGILLVVGVGADALGLGPSPGFGWKQQLAAAVGAVAGVVGLIGLARSRG